MRSVLASGFRILVALSMAAGVAATDHIVGANKGWNPGMNYTLWAGNHTFYVGDFISFRYQKTQYNVFQVNQTGYDNCTTQGATGNWTSGKDFILLTDPKRYYFICGNGQCFSGMKVSVLVHPLASPPAALAKDESSSVAAAAPTFIAYLLLLTAFIFFFLRIETGSGVAMPSNPSWIQHHVPTLPSVASVWLHN